MYIRELQRDLELRPLELWDTDEEYRTHWLEQAEDKIILGTQGRSLLTETRLRNLIRCVRATMHLTQSMVELGTFRGGSAWCISQADPARTLYCLDTWEGHPIDEEGGHAQGDFATDRTEVATFLGPCNVSLIPGTFRGGSAERLTEKYSLAHIDCDYLTDDMLTWFWNGLVSDGILIVDDYGQPDCPTVKPAVDRLIEAKGLTLYLEERQAIIQKTASRHVPHVKSGKREILIEQRLSPGDMIGGVVPLIESIHKQFPGEYLTDVAGTCSDVIFSGNPFITKLRSPDQRFYAHYNVNGSDNRAFSFAQAHCDHFSQVMKLPRPLINQTRRPSLYLTEAERERLPGLPAHYAVLTAGYKTDCSIKGQGSHLFWRDVVDYCLSHGVQVLQVGERSTSHIHERIPGVTDLVGKTTLRQLMRLVAGSVCTLSSISLLTHISAAFDIPNLCLSSRESNDFAMYRTTISLNCIGLLPCASNGSTGGCWRNHLEKFDGQGKLTGDSCALPLIQEDGSKVPTCTSIVRRSGAAQAHLLKIFLAKGLI